MFTTMQAVEGSLGLNLDYWAAVDMAGFEDVVDAIGGVKIDVERPIPMGGGKSMSGVANEVYGWVDLARRHSKARTHSGTSGRVKAATTTTACAVSSA